MSLATVLAAEDLDVAQNVFFGLLSLAAVVGALRVVTTTNVVHAALWLVLVLAAVGGSFLMVGAEFVGITQVLVYIGAIIVLFLFGTMLTRAPIGKDPTVDNPLGQRGVAAVIALALGGLLAFVLVDEWGGDHVREVNPVGNTAAVSDSIFSQYLVPFEAIGLLLTAALIGAIVLARKE